MRRLEQTLVAGAALALTLTGCGQTQQKGGGAGGDGAGGDGASGDGASEGGASGRGATDEPKPAETETPPRLLSWQLQAPGTRPLLLGIFDSLRGQHCRFLLDEQGHLRCLPLPPTPLDVVGFADADCTQRVYAVSHVDDVTSITRYAMAVPLDPTDCEQRYAVGGLRELGRSEPHFSGTPADCRQYAPLEPQPGRHELVVSTSMSPGDWANGREANGLLVSDRLKLQRFTAEGGESFPSRLVAEPWEESCTLRDLNDTVLCLPPALPSITQYFGDADCQSQPLWRIDACARPVHTGTPGDLHALGEVWQGPIFAQSKVCQRLREGDISPGERFLVQGEAVGQDALPDTEWTNEGDGRLQLRGLRASDGSFVALPDDLFDSSSQRRFPLEFHTSRFFDNETGEGCTPVWTRDAGIRCVPESTAVDPYTFEMYADSSCTEPAYMCTSGTCPSELVVMGYDQNGEYRALSRNRAEEIFGTTYLGGIGGPGNCQEAAAAPPTMMKAGEVLPWDAYPELQELNGRASGAP